MIIIGIDPGINGGICLMRDKNISISKMPETPMDLLNLLSAYSKISKDIICITEKLHGMPGMGGVSMFKFGRGYGQLEMALLCLGIKTIPVSPVVWQKYYGIGTKKDCKSPTEWKNKLRIKAEQLFPKQKIFLWGADAILIAEYARVNKLS